MAILEVVGSRRSGRQHQRLSRRAQPRRGAFSSAVAHHARTRPDAAAGPPCRRRAHGVCVGTAKPVAEPTLRRAQARGCALGRDRAAATTTGRDATDAGLEATPRRREEAARPDQATAPSRRQRGLARPAVRLLAWPAVVTRSTCATQRPPQQSSEQRAHADEGAQSDQYRTHRVVHRARSIRPGSRRAPRRRRAPAWTRSRSPRGSSRA